MQTVKILLPEGQIGHLVHPKQSFSLSRRDLQRCLRTSAGAPAFGLICMHAFMTVAGRFRILRLGCT